VSERKLKVFHYISNVFFALFFRLIKKCAAAAAFHYVILELTASKRAPRSVSGSVRLSVVEFLSGERLFCKPKVFVIFLSLPRRREVSIFPVGVFA
jgi:hypothetical protein